MNTIEKTPAVKNQNTNKLKKHAKNIAMTTAGLAVVTGAVYKGNLYCHANLSPNLKSEFKISDLGAKIGGVINKIGELVLPYKSSVAKKIFKKPYSSIAELKKYPDAFKVHTDKIISLYKKSMTLTKGRAVLFAVGAGVTAGVIAKGIRNAIKINNSEK